MTNKFLNIDFLCDSLKDFDDGKKHIFITGDVKVGKTTLLNQFIKKYYSDKVFDGVITELVISDKFRVVLNRFNSSEKFVIGERNINGMNFYDEIFLEKNDEIFKNLRKDMDILILDEIGNKELHLKNHTQKLLNLFNKHRVFAVLKKVGNPIFENLEKVGEYILFDLDKFYE